MRPDLRRVLLGLAAGLLLVGIPADAQIRPDRKDPKFIYWQITNVKIDVSREDYNLATMRAVVTVPRAIVGHVLTPDRWEVFVSADAHFMFKPGHAGSEVSTKPCSDLEIQWVDGNGGFTRLTRGERQVAQGVGEGWLRREEVAFNLRFTAKADDQAGQYRIDLRFRYETHGKR